MDYTFAIRELYSIFFDEETIFAVETDYDRIKNTYKLLSDAYRPKPASQSDDFVSWPDYNDAYNQFVYLHKFAQIHTGLACDILQKIFRNGYVFIDITLKKKLNLCSLGGGPGTDIFALLFVLNEVFANVECKISVIDIAPSWKNVFNRLISKMILTFCDHSRPLPSWSKNYEYLNADLLSLPLGVSTEALDVISDADIITMIKFISAVDRCKTQEMLQAVMNTMKPGAMLLFIDNAAGGFHEMVEKSARQCGLTSVFGPLKHYPYAEPRLATVFHGNWSLDRVRVTVQMWKKMTINDHLDVYLSACILQVFTAF